MRIADSAPLIEALVKLCDEFSQIHNVSGPSASTVVNDLLGLYLLNESSTPVTPRYQSLLDQAEAMIKQHFGVTQLDNDILEKLLEDMWNLEETAND